MPRLSLKKIREQAGPGDWETVARRYAVGITDHVARTIKSWSPDDPVARQYMPDRQELSISPEENPDPIGDDVHSPVRGIVHRYPDRVLLKIINVCAVYCRFCFRREMVGPGQKNLTDAELDEAINYIETNPQIWEVILTGGDPLILTPRKLSEVLDRLEAIEHVKILRIHTRIPVADPARITEDLCTALTRRKALYVSLHVNHVQEISEDTESAIQSLQKTGAVLVSQSVLLKNVNDNTEALENLFRKLVELRVRPYYLHHADRAPGTKHFRTSLEKGRNLMKSLLGRLSGLCQPTYALDIPGGHGKTPIGPSYLEQDENGVIVEDYQGNKHRYSDN